jgi:creatinine amidohydrolase/Fe(II)-dependent formamide hydrolase-like protein
VRAGTARSAARSAEAPVSSAYEDSGGWVEGLRLLRARNAAVPESLRLALTSPVDEAAIAESIGPGGVVATGAGSSAAHARFLASVLGELGVAARFAPLSEFLTESPSAARRTLVLFSQGLSPNARIALRQAASWHSIWIATATGGKVSGGDGPPGGDGDARRRALDDAIAAGARVLSYPGADEFGTLLRVIGPMNGYAAALRFATAAARARPSWNEVPVGDICAAVAGASGKLARAAGDLPAHELERSLLLTASGVHTARLENLRLKFLEGTLRPPPPVWDLLELAHGPFQQLFAGAATLLAFTRADAAEEDELMARLAAMLDPDRHRLVQLPSGLPGPLAIFEHESLMNELVLGYVAERRIDACRWPGKNLDGPLYSFDGGGPRADAARASADVAASHADRRGAGSERPGRRLEHLAWPELDAFLAPGGRTAILPLGSIEQHGPHLPFATDAWIAGELARRLGSRIPESVELPVLPFGCASEHLGFPGTLSLGEETFARVLADIAASVSRHGFARLFVFSAHGGNRRALEQAIPRLREAAGSLEVIVAPGLGATMDVFHRESARHDVSADASGHHAGEFETSIMLAVAPQSVRSDRLAAGTSAGEGDLDEFFYPDLRANAADGTVGDPRGADAARAEAYLEAWVASLLEIYRKGSR